MTEQELRKLNRRDLLELLVSQGKERDALQAELEETKAALADRQLHIAEMGSIAEAALMVNGVFDTAQKAADQYLENIKQRSEQTDKRCTQLEQEARAKSRPAASGSRSGLPVSWKKTPNAAVSKWRKMPRKKQKPTGQRFPSA